MRQPLDRRFLPLHLNASMQKFLSDEEDMVARSDDGVLWTFREDLRGGVWHGETGEYIPAAAVRIHLT